MTIELSLDVITAVLGFFVALRAGDNYPKRYWGLIALLIGSMFAWENIGWLAIVSEAPEYRFTDLLNVEKMLKWYVLAGIVALYPLSSLFPGYLTPFRTLLYQLPTIVVTTVGISYILFNGTFTPLYTMADIIAELGKFDVQLRIGIFLFSVITPLFVLFFPILRRRGFRLSNHRMRLFLAFLLLFTVVYMAFTLSISYFVFNLFGAMAIVFTLVFSVMYLRMESPFSDHAASVPSSGSAASAEADCSEEPIGRAEPFSTASSTVDNSTFSVIAAYMEDKRPYTEPDYSVEMLADELHLRPRRVSEAIKSAGYSGYREYVTILRLDCFHALATEHPERSIKELMFAAGFKSKATFYRNFKTRYGTTATQFIESLSGTNTDK